MMSENANGLSGFELFQNQHNPEKYSFRVFVEIFNRIGIYFCETGFQRHRLRNGFINISFDVFPVFPLTDRSPNDFWERVFDNWIGPANDEKSRPWRTSQLLKKDMDFGVRFDACGSIRYLQ